MSRIDDAFQNVNRDEFVLREDGSVVMQSTASETIRKSLELLNLQEGNRVLEIGTGSGFSTALLSYLVGSRGFVVSIDIEPELTSRARELFRQKNISNVRFETKDGRQGDEEGAPYDCIVAWATADYLPQSWINQLNNQGVLVAPFLVGGVANSIFLCQMKKECNDLIGKKTFPSGYIIMNETPNYESFGHELASDVKKMSKNGSQALAWASSKWLRNVPEEQRIEFLKTFVRQTPEKSVFDLNGKMDDFRAYLFSQQKEGLTTAFRLDEGNFIGYSDENEFALLSQSKSLVVANGENAKLILQTWFEDWMKLGQVGFESMIPVIQQDGEKFVVCLSLSK